MLKRTFLFSWANKEKKGGRERERARKGIKEEKGEEGGNVPRFSLVPHRLEAEVTH